MSTKNVPVSTTTINGTQWTVKGEGKFKLEVDERKTIYRADTMKELNKLVRLDGQAERRVDRRDNRRVETAKLDCYAWIGRLMMNPDMPIRIVVEGGQNGFETAFTENALDKDTPGALKINALALNPDGHVYAIRVIRSGADDQWLALSDQRKDQNRETIAFPAGLAAKLEAVAETAFSERDAKEGAEVDRAAKKSAAAAPKPADKKK